MSYHEFLAYLYDREATRDLAITLAAAVREADHAQHAPPQHAAALAHAG